MTLFIILITFIIGVLIGFIVAALCAAAGDSDKTTEENFRTEEVKQRRYHFTYNDDRLNKEVREYLYAAEKALNELEDELYESEES